MVFSGDDGTGLGREEEGRRRRGYGRKENGRPQGTGGGRVSGCVLGMLCG
jgi:hypothetical protein